MRVISGLFKGKKLLKPRDKETRPLKDLTKESIFNIINHSNKLKINLESCNVLDLFSGIGSFGIECLSRGAKSVVFAENYIGVISILKKNLSSLKSITNYKIIEKDIVKSKILSNLKKKFDIIFLDPPYKDRNLENILISIYNEEILNKNGIIIIHRHKNETIVFPEYYKIIEEKKYGISKIVFFSILN